MYFKISILILIHIVAVCYTARVKRIVGGDVANISNFPYQVSLTVDGNSNCSGSIIAKTWVLTTAFCVNGGNMNVNAIKFRAGSNFKNIGGTVHQAIKIVIHDEYNSKTREHDFALVQVQEPFDIGFGDVDKINLVWSEVADDTMATLSGWGLVNNNTATPTDKLHSVEVPIVNKRICNGVWATRYLVTQYVLCAGYAKGGKDGCVGDLGAPLVVNDDQVGILSRAFCGQPNSPSIYTEISRGRQWIRSVTNV